VNTPDPTRRISEKLGVTVKKESLLMRAQINLDQAQVQPLLSQLLADQQVVRKRFPQAEELQTSSLNQAKTTSQAYEC
jgi:hypothetical protein